MRGRVLLRRKRKTKLDVLGVRSLGIILMIALLPFVIFVSLSIMSHHLATC
jgi:uncharacterized membrane protein